VSQTIRRALLSVSNKEGLLEFARALREHDVLLLSTGGTARLLRDDGIEVTDVSEITAFPEIMGGRVKTLHPRIHGGLLGRRSVDDEVMREHGIEPIDLVAVNLYPFAETTARPDCSFDDAVENIDIGGPAMVRAAAKNHDRVAVVVDPLDYGTVLAEMDRNSGAVLAETRLRLATKAFSHTAQYDATVAAYLDRAARPAVGDFPELLSLQYRKRLNLRYGENPHQQAAFYVATDAQGASLGSASQLQGKELSYNNIADADTAFECVRQFGQPACVIVKHANPCGVAVAEEIRTAYDHAFRTVYDERALVRHPRVVAHVDALALDLPRLLDQQLDVHIERLAEGQLERRVARRHRDRSRRGVLVADGHATAGGLGETRSPALSLGH